MVRGEKFYDICPSMDEEMKASSQPSDQDINKDKSKFKTFLILTTVFYQV
jgi:hypothetical protein